MKLIKKVTSEFEDGTTATYTREQLIKKFRKVEAHKKRLGMFRSIVRYLPNPAIYACPMVPICFTVPILHA